MHLGLSEKTADGKHRLNMSQINDEKPAIYPQITTLRHIHTL